MMKVKRFYLSNDFEITFNSWSENKDVQHMQIYGKDDEMFILVFYEEVK